jgi:hypothetical protein
MANSRKKEENYILVLKPWLGKIHVLAEPWGQKRHTVIDIKENSTVPKFFREFLATWNILTHLVHEETNLLSSYYWII